MALEEAGLVQALQAEGPFTVFAPTNQAFTDLLQTLDISAEELLMQPDLANVLLYHVVPAEVFSTDLSDGMIAPTLNGDETLTVDLSDGVKINTSTVTLADLDATNGVIHVIDTVLVPSNFTYQAVDIPQTGDNGLIFISSLGFLAIAGLFLMRKKVLT